MVQQIGFADGGGRGSREGSQAGQGMPSRSRSTTMANRPTPRSKIESIPTQSSDGRNWLPTEVVAPSARSRIHCPRRDVSCGQWATRAATPPSITGPAADIASAWAATETQTTVTSTAESIVTGLGRVSTIPPHYRQFRPESNSPGRSGPLFADQVSLWARLAIDCRTAEPLLRQSGIEHNRPASDRRIFLELSTSWMVPSFGAATACPQENSLY